MNLPKKKRNKRSEISAYKISRSSYDTYQKVCWMDERRKSNMLHQLQWSLGHKKIYIDKVRQNKKKTRNKIAMQYLYRWSKSVQNLKFITTNLNFSMIHRKTEAFQKLKKENIKISPCIKTLKHKENGNISINVIAWYKMIMM